MGNRYKVIMLCGNPEFKEDFLREQGRLTLAGNVVMGIVSQNYAQNDLSVCEEMLFDRLTKQQIEMADEVFVINKHDKIDLATDNNIRYAVICGKPIRYMEKHYA